jgi:hypothetical protein
LAKSRAGHDWLCVANRAMCVSLGAANSAPQGEAHMSFEAELKAEKCREKRL